MEKEVIKTKSKDKEEEEEATSCYKEENLRTRIWYNQDKYTKIVEMLMLNKEDVVHKWSETILYC